VGGKKREQSKGGRYRLQFYIICGKFYKEADKVNEQYPKKEERIWKTSLR
jgi:hypothetical protein